MNHVVLQATPFTERGRVWSRCNYRVVAEECNYRPLRLGNKTLTSTKQVTYCTPWQRMQSAKSADLIGHIKFLRWRQLGCHVSRPLPLSVKGVACETMSDVEDLTPPPPQTHTHTHMLHTHTHRSTYVDGNHMISFVSRFVPIYARAWEQGYHTIHKTVASLPGIVQLSISFSTYWKKRNPV